MPQIQPETFAKVMRLPQGMRTDLLEFIGRCHVGDQELRRIIDGMSKNYTPEPKSS